MAAPKLTDRTSFSAPAGFWKDFDARAKAQGYDSGSEYLRALYEADLSYGLRPALEPGTMRRVLRIASHIEGQPAVGHQRKPGK
jgi:hypothetical protein